MKKYTAFQCGACGLINVIPGNCTEGYLCMECKGYLLSIGKAVVKKDSLHNITITCDTTELDNAIDKVNLLSDKLDAVMDKMDKVENG